MTGGRRPIVSGSCWVGRDLSDATSWSVMLSKSQRQAIVDAARGAAANGVTPATVEREQLDLPQLRAEVAKWGATSNKGRGFVLRRGFPVDDLNSSLGGGATCFGSGWPLATSPTWRKRSEGYSGRQTEETVGERS